MLFGTVTSTLKYSNYQARRLEMAILSVQWFYVCSNKKKLYFEEKNSENENNP